MLVEIRGRILLYILALFPFISYLFRSYLDVSFGNVFGFITIVLTLDLLIEKAASNTPFNVPRYLLFYGLFVLYAFITGSIISSVVVKLGVIKYLYSSLYVKTFFMFLIIENTKFSLTTIRNTVIILFVHLVIAAIVIIFQYFDPYFFFNKAIFFDENVQNERQLNTYLSTSSTLLNSSTKRVLLQGYRFSIYSWISEPSIGVDGIAIFSILFGSRFFLKSQNRILLISGAILSFLSSSRWIMLNFLVTSFQSVISEGKLWRRVFTYFLGLIFVLAAGFFLLPVLLGFDIQQFIEKRLLSQSASSRIFAFYVFSEVFPSNPIFGTGGGETKEVLQLIKGISSQIHVGWLKIFYHFGIVGAFFWISAFVFLLSELRLRARRTEYWGPYFAFLAFAIANLTLVSFHYFYHGLVLAMIFSRYISNNSNPPLESS